MNPIPSDTAVLTETQVTEIKSDLDGRSSCQADRDALVASHESLRSQLAASHRELAETRDNLEEVEGACVVMREAIAELPLSTFRDRGETEVTKHFTVEVLGDCLDACRAAVKDGSSGRDLLARIKMLEAVAEAARPLTWGAEPKYERIKDAYEALDAAKAGNHA